MPSLKDLKVRINSVKSTQKITSAMKMVAASKLRRAQEQVEASRPYALRMERMLTTLSASFSDDDHVSSGDDEGRVPRMIKGTGSDQVHLIVVVTSDRGLCGAFNSGIVREVRKRLHELKKDGKTVKIITVGRKGRDILRREFSSDIVESHDEVGKRRTLYAEADAITQKVLALFKAKEFDVCTVYFNQFKSVISQVVTAHQLLPIPRPKVKPKTQGPRDLLARDEDVVAANDVPFMFEFEPDEEVVLKSLLPHHMKIQIYRALLESSASEQGARMTAMDNATRNAGEMIQKLTLNYNRTRQAVITKELIEIISGAEAL